ncbi:Response regulator receiver domain-containing protein [Desulfatibacillum alkenivorans DSM 16219]|jgi:CheY-like chemotaxis protein|uniref:Response regulator receiver domain-containing protein n=1 Tax=Desulfatibacillum alkenivorans DSM 16219 TaxID=1121393 RepID=A0A1M6F4M3_9BACT|nr:response regulator [Desulfatibacillum alkenivorans]SHI92616.1 Response regulator receiver domain-containing protein [Desulfatibacillum alkenivorans DSM 16219]
MAKILIAEDDLITRKVLYKIVEGMGHSVIMSPNGRHAWETLETNPDISMLITDVMMPEMDGRDLIELVRAREEFQNLPIIIISAVVGPKAVANLLKMGATLFLSKPLKVDETRKYIERWVEV